MPHEFPPVVAILPCYESARFVGDAVGSVLAQTYQPIEIVIVDDGSPDDLDAALAPFCGQIRIIRRSNGGPATARNTGIDATDAPLIAFLDPDDRWHPQKIQRQVEHLARYPDCGMVCTYRSAIDIDGRAIPKPAWWSRTLPPGSTPPVELLTTCSIMSSQVVLRRSLLGNDRFDPSATPIEDWDLWLRLAGRSRICCIAEPLTEYRVHAGNLSGTRATLLPAAAAMFERAIARLPEGHARSLAVANHARVLSELRARSSQPGVRSTRG